MSDAYLIAEEIKSAAAEFNRLAEQALKLGIRVDLKVEHLRTTLGDAPFLIVEVARKM